MSRHYGDLGVRRAKPMGFGKYQTEGWWEIDVLESNPGALNRMRVIFRFVNSDMEAKLLQVH